LKFSIKNLNKDLNQSLNKAKALMSSKKTVQHPMRKSLKKRKQKWKLIHSLYRLG